MQSRKPVAKAEKPTFGSFLMNIPLQDLGSKLVYVVLLGAFLVIGYLFGSIFPLQGGGVSTIANNAAAPDPAAQAQAPAAPAAPDPADVLQKLKNGHLPIKGDENAPVTIVEFSDFECPFCGRFYSETLSKIITDYVDTGKAKLYYRHYPLSFHPNATPLALASECANDQGKFWEMHDLIFEKTVAGTSSTATADTMKQWAVDLGLDANTFNSCLDNKTHQSKVDEDFAAGNEVGVSGTPTFYINGKQLVGAQPFESFKAIIDEELK